VLGGGGVAGSEQAKAASAVKLETTIAEATRMDMGRRV
jgi:hypothetical protein